ncbi:MAG: cytochrome c [Thioalkalivibrio sp.]|nr:cytochrome c [Thioalkalivibrio sp.]
MRHGLTAFGILCCVSLASPALASDPALGEELHQENCVSCHGTEVYTRDDRMVDSMSSLITQVNRCNVNLGTGWFDDEVEAVAAYLGENYYNF